MPASPIIKWVGGKSRLVPELTKRAPKEFRRYFEPFLGGGALFFALEPDDACLGDMNHPLVEMYLAVAERPEAVISRLEQHKKNNVNGYYYEVREWWNTRREFSTDKVGAAAAFIFLNKTCFNGLWRVNRDGLFNVPKGDYKDPSIFDPEAIRTAARALSSARLTACEYDATTAEAQAGDFAYFDPPYDPISQTSNFTSYTKDAFGKAQQKKLAQHARELADKGVQVMLSNNDTPLVRELYDGFTIDVVQRAGTVSSKGSKRGKVNEVIITSYPREAA